MGFFQLGKAGLAMLCAKGVLKVKLRCNMHGVLVKMRSHFCEESEPSVRNSHSKLSIFHQIF